MNKIAIGLLIDVKHDLAPNNQSNVINIKKAFLPLMLKLEPQDVLLFSNDGQEVYAYVRPGEFTAAISNLQPNIKVNVPKVIKELVNGLADLPNDYKKKLIIITDSKKFQYYFHTADVEIKIYGIGIELQVPFFEKLEDTSKLLEIKFSDIGN